MVTVQLSDDDWSLVIKYWQDLQKHLNHPDDLKKINFLNRIIFKSTDVNISHSQTTAGIVTADDKDRTNISAISIAKMSEIMNEIDNELEKREKKLDDLKTVDDERKIDSKIRTFIVEPV